MNVGELEDAFGRIRPGLERYLIRLSGRDSARDLVQETYARALAGLEGFQGKASIKNWLYRIAGNLAVDELRRRHRGERAAAAVSYPADCTDLDAAQAFLDVVDDRPWNDAEERRERKEMGDCIARFVSELQPAFKTIVILREFDHLEYEDIAEMTGTSVENVRVRLHRARAALRKALEQGCHIWKSRHGGTECPPKRV